MTTCNKWWRCESEATDSKQQTAGRAVRLKMHSQVVMTIRELHSRLEKKTACCEMAARGSCAGVLILRATK